jgi:UDP-glucose-4-epimerase GalE
VRVLVTGGAGYIGSVVTERLLEAGHRAVVVDDLSTGHREAVAPDAELIVVDLRDAAALRRALDGRDFDAVIHLAASSLVGESMEDPGKYFENNLSAGIHVLEASLARGATRFVLSSTAATYGEPAAVPIPEDSPTVPTNPYGESKLLYERVLAWYSRLKGLRWISLRYFNAAGASRERGEDRAHETHLIPLVLAAATSGGEVSVFGEDYPTPDGTCVRDYIHVLDLADAHVLALDAIDRGVGGIFNLGSGTGFSVREVIAVAEKVVGVKIRSRVAPRRPGDPAVLVASSRRARETLGWRPSRDDLEEIVRSAWDWRQRHPRGYRAGA